jgi:hypothetical protein
MYEYIYIGIDIDLDIWIMDNNNNNYTVIRRFEKQCECFIDIYGHEELPGTFEKILECELCENNRMIEEKKEVEREIIEYLTIRNQKLCNFIEKTMTIGLKLVLRKEIHYFDDIRKSRGYNKNEIMAKPFLKHLDKKELSNELIHFQKFKNNLYFNELAVALFYKERLDEWYYINLY